MTETTPVGSRPRSTSRSFLSRHLGPSGRRHNGIKGIKSKTQKTPAATSADSSSDRPCFSWPCTSASSTDVTTAGRARANSRAGEGSKAEQRLREIAQERTMSEAQAAVLVKSGIATKRTTYTKEWHPLYFELYRDCLIYYENRGGAEKGRMVLHADDLSFVPVAASTGADADADADAGADADADADGATATTAGSWPLSATMSH